MTTWPYNSARGRAGAFLGQGALSACGCRIGKSWTIKKNEKTVHEWHECTRKNTNKITGRTRGLCTWHSLQRLLINCDPHYEKNSKASGRHQEYMSALSVHALLIPCSPLHPSGRGDVRCRVYHGSMAMYDVPQKKSSLLPKMGTYLKVISFPQNSLRASR